MALLPLLLLSTLLWGASSYISPTQLAVGSALVACWLLAFAVRERIARARRATTLEG
jgi:hypothetical protein